MKTLLTKLNFELSDSKEFKSSKKLLLVYNKDKTIRWLLPANAKQAYFLKFYSAHNLKSKLYSFVVKTLFALGLQSFFWKTKVVFFKNEALKNHKVDLSGSEWALFAGTPGPNNKILFYDAKTQNFSKIAGSEQAQKLILKEQKVLEKMAALEIDIIEIPKVKNLSNERIELSDVSKNATRSQTFSKIHQDALTAIYSKSILKLHKYRVPALVKTHMILNKLDGFNDDRIPANLLTKLRAILNNLSENNISLAQAHGDFTPWNSMIKQDKLAIYDWELSDSLLPVGYDAFHFIMQDAILVKRKNWAEIKEEILGLDPNLIQKWAKNPEAKILNYLKLYLLINISYYLKIYSLQEKWHTQVYWLLEVWNEAVSDLVSAEDVQRAALISNFFDFIQAKEYAVIKDSNQHPELLSEFSDLDITIHKKDLKSIIDFFELHSFSKKIIVTKKSFMASIDVFLNNGQLLSLDLIWNFKVKSLTFLSASEVLKQHTKNDFNVKQMNLKHTAIYLACFYGLNSADIPSKYQHFKTAIDLNDFPQFQVFKSIFNQRALQQKQLFTTVKAMPENNKFPGLLNKFNYVLDTIKKFIPSKGLIISFSGVDGAGKTTIIAETKMQIEKKLRKKVVVLRHRPSLLPILSTWTKGNEQAQKDVLASLPRQGQNKSLLSSLLRFSYYFADYFIGQFYILVKHVWRGEVVLYDRYYFDFINDAKRSNIVLPKGFSKFAYSFIMTPDLNFFLYADSETILKRKKELEAETIRELNQKYIQLFDDLGKNEDGKFYNIKNIHLDKTLDIIMDNTIKKVA